ncbi:polysaccharide biosynthesis/export family protein [uncultured Pseudomonas sp.]|uniref:polysaccharide biosynthesis/export family protein n=1 Tax=uncultured Pseudomonas sp. TaxID=114707 RepID=UPI0025ECA464|nr:polysaccharide biosynthesis/export family protein [uncultured Pseudomonas sp.]
MNRRFFRGLAFGPLLLLLGACGTPAKIGLPDTRTLEAGHAAYAQLALQPAPPVLVQPGDTLRISRDARSPAEEDRQTLFVVQPDGYIHYPYVGRLAVAGLTPDQVSQRLTAAGAQLYREPRVTVNIAVAPSNRIFVGGEVHNPSVYELNGQASVEQALIGAGGLLPSADSGNIALVRRDASGRYQRYFFAFSDLLSGNLPPVALQRGDLIFVPKSGIGNAVEAVDMYFTRLIPINKGIGVGLNYDLNQRDISNSGNTNIRTVCSAGANCQ